MFRRFGRAAPHELSELENNSRVGDVRGKGLLFGIELVEDEEGKQPASAKTVEAAISGRKERGLVISKNGARSPASTTC